MRRLVTAGMRRYGASRVARIALAGSIACGAAGVGLLVVPTTFGATNDTAANPNNTFSTGTLLITSSNPGSYIISVANAVPGDVKTGTLTITNAGSYPATMTVAITNIAHQTCAQTGLNCSAGTGGGDLSAYVKVKFEDLTKGTTLIPGTTLWKDTGAGNPYSLPGTSAAQWASGEAHTFRVTATFPKSTAAVDNPFQGTRAKFDAVFTGTQ